MHAKSSPRLCPTCGNGLESSGNCNVCLLELGITQTGVDERQSDDSLPSLDELNAQFPQLEISRIVGRGGMGAIYHARQTSLDRDVALKLIAKEVSSDATFVERFEREAKALAKLSHPNIVTIFDFGRTQDGTAYLILEFVEGVNLREAISSGNIGSDEALEIVSTICRALEYAHSKGVVHRDIKPENILLGEDGTLKVADFGIAKIVDESVRPPTLTGTRQVLGSLHYLAPEHLEAPDQVDHRVDLFALGVVFYELLTGQLPLGRYEAPSKFQNHVDQRLDAIVLKTLSRRPQQRYQNAAELDSDILDVVTSMKNHPIPQGSVGDAGLPPTQDAEGSISVPFSCESTVEVVGIVHVREGTLCAEFRMRNLLGYMKRKTHVVEIPRQHITRLELVSGFLGAKLLVSTDTISALGDFPNAETGQVVLKIKRHDEGFAREVTHVLGFDSMQIADRRTEGGPIHWPNQPNDFLRILFGLLMILCGILNAIGLVVCEYVFGHRLDGVWLVASAFAAAVTMGPLAILQVITGILNLIGRVRTLSLTTSVLCTIPLSPIWIISCPIGIWAYRAFKQGEQGASAGGFAVKKSWGATTLMFIRESRWAKATGLVSTTAGVVVIAAVIAFNFGYYPTEMRYRIFNTQSGNVEVDAAVNTRLQTCAGFRGIAYEPLSQPAFLGVKAWQCSRNEIENLLSVQSIPQLAWLQSTNQTQVSGADMSSDELRREQPIGTIPVVPGIDTTAFRTLRHNLGTVLQPASESFDLSADFVGKVSISNDNDQRLLTIELTTRGREQLAAKAGVNSNDGLALVIADLVEGIATKSSISPKQIVFELSDTSELTSDGIAAGIRGPNIPAQLELLGSP